MGLFYGGLAQIIAGILEFRKGNTFGVTAFTSYGLFWLTLVFILIFKELPGNAEAFMSWYFFMWGLFTFFMWLGTFGKNRVVQFVFLSLTILFVLLAVRDWTGNKAIGIIAGWEEWLAAYQLCIWPWRSSWLQSLGRTVLPIGEI